MTTPTYDVAVIGGGAAGLSAALVLGRARRRVAVIDAGSPRNAPAAHMQGYLSRDGMPPAELLTAGRDEVRAYGVELIDDRVVSIEPGFTVRRAAGDPLTARTLLLATGATDILPDIEGARERWGRDFLHCPYCHGWEVRDQAIGVLQDAGHAQLLRQWSADVTLFAHTQPVTADERASLTARGIAIVEGPIARFAVADDRLHGVELADGRVVKRDVVFMRPTMHTRAGALAEALGAEADCAGFVRADPTGQTSVPGLWVAGNATNPRAQVITAAGEGSAAAIAINAFLTEHDIHKETS